MKYEIVSLSEMLVRLPEYQVSKILSGFTCSRDSDRQRFLCNQAIPQEKRSLSRTYLVLDEDQKVLGYFTVGMKCLHVPADTPVSSRTLKRMNVDGDTGVAQSYLHGQLGRADDSPKGLGVRMIGDALGIFKTASRLVGCRMIRLDCSDELVRYYQDNGFILIGRNRRNNLNQMAVVI